MTSPFPVAFNPQDRFVVTMGNRIIVTTQNGSVFGHDVANNAVGGAFGFGGSKVALNGPVDRFVVTMGTRLIVITQNGSVFGHDVTGNTVGGVWVRWLEGGVQWSRGPVCPHDGEPAHRHHAERFGLWS